jgi:uncharacterized protein
MDVGGEAMPLPCGLTVSNSLRGPRPPPCRQRLGRQGRSAWPMIGRVAALLLVVPTLWVAPLRAQAAGTSDALQAANELFSVLSGDLVKQMVDQVTAQVWPPLERQLRAKSPALADDTLAALRLEFERIQNSNLADLFKEAPAIYARHFTAAELRDLTAFYRTPTGQKALRVLPQVMGEVLATIMPRLQQVQAQTLEAFKRVLRERGYAI